MARAVRHAMRHFELGHQAQVHSPAIRMNTSELGMVENRRSGTLSPIASPSNSSLGMTLGRCSDDVRPGLRRMECGKHVMFYRLRKADGILVVRILHQRMLPERHDIN